jgi:hypothetical protein
MATKKAAAKKAPGKAMQSWDEQLAKLAEISAGVEDSVNLGGNYISLKGGVFNYNGGIVPGNKMNVIVLDHVLENLYYEGRYDPDNPQSPSAYAIGRDEETLTWSEDSIPEYAGTLCKDSDINQWGSADQGRGKACKNTRRLALITEDSLDDVADAEVAMMRIPVTSVKAWAGYVRSLADQLKRPPLGVVTEISLVPDAKTQFKMQFKLIGTIDDGDAIGELIEKRDTVEQALFAGYDMSEREAPAPVRGRGRAAPSAGRSKVAAKGAAGNKRR